MEKLKNLSTCHVKGFDKCRPSHDFLSQGNSIQQRNMITHEDKCRPSHDFLSQGNSIRQRNMITHE
jgi:hypothetical protein